MHKPPSLPLVLVADDDTSNLARLSSMFASEGIDVAVVTNGIDVLQAVSREMPDLIILDAVMPGIDGFETCERLRANPSTKEIPVIFMTSLVDEPHRVRGFGVGAVDYVTKPFQQAELLARVRTHISLRHATRDLKEKNAQLSRQVEERDAAERKLERAMEQLRDANTQLSRELERREQAEASRVALQEQVIAAQRERLLELSAPLIPITSWILAMPLIGAIDVERAQQAVEAALRGAVERGAEYLIIDVTGVKDVNTTVATMLVQAAKGLALLGTRAVITGIRPAVAQTLVGLSVPLDALVTRGTLQAGIEHALRTRGGRSSFNPEK